MIQKNQQRHPWKDMMQNQQQSHIRCSKKHHIDYLKIQKRFLSFAKQPNQNLTEKTNPN